MQVFEINKTQFRVTDFLSWQRQGTLKLNPAFQRRSVWKPEAKSYFVDTVVRGLPAPIIYLRERIDLDTQSTMREVIDGQQRLRTLFSFIDENLLKDFNPNRDRFTVKRIHNAGVSGKHFSELSQELRTRILSYEFSTHTLPINVEDRDVLQMFARLNSTGVKLNSQELRNAEYFGIFKTLMYELALEQLERWREWRIFSEEDIARMREVEMTSDLAANMIEGLRGKTKNSIDEIYRRYDDKLPGEEELKRRFRQVMDMIHEILSKDISSSVYTMEVYFFTLFVCLYDLMYDLGSKLEKRKPSKLSNLREKLLTFSTKISNEKDLPPHVLDSVQQKRSDLDRRKTRIEYLASICDG